jgi:endonuclease/exonuclease/phosphatase family metal-dependent hydrolase
VALDYRPFEELFLDHDDDGTIASEHSRGRQLYDLALRHFILNGTEPDCLSLATIPTDIWTDNPDQMPTLRPLRIDVVLANQPLIDKFGRARCVADRGNHTASLSDHFPVWCDLQ